MSENLKSFLKYKFEIAKKNQSNITLNDLKFDFVWGSKNGTNNGFDICNIFFKNKMITYFIFYNIDNLIDELTRKRSAKPSLELIYSELLIHKLKDISK